MRVAALYDIHGNLPALEAVLAEVDADTILVGGDAVLGPMPKETLALLREREATFIRGNCERLVVAPPDGKDVWDDWARWAHSQLDDEELAFLGGLPHPLALEVEGVGDVLFCHGSPRSDEDVVTAISDPERVAPMLTGVDEAIVVSGHTHVQFDQSVAGHRLINAGSIGMPYQGVAGRAFWTIFGPGVEPRSSAFDADLFAATLRATGYPHPEWFEVETAEAAAEEYEQMARNQSAGS
jgi:predicted phosphodiesterase